MSERTPTTTQDAPESHETGAGGDTRQEDFVDAILSDSTLSEEQQRHWLAVSARDYLARAEAAEAKLAAVAAVCDALEIDAKHFRDDQYYTAQGELEAVARVRAAMEGGNDLP